MIHSTSRRFRHLGYGLLIGMLLMSSALLLEGCAKRAPAIPPGQGSTQHSLTTEIVKQNERMAAANETAMELILVGTRTEVIKPGTALILMDWHVRIARASNAIAYITRSGPMDATRLALIREQIMKLAMPPIYASLREEFTDEEKRLLEAAISTVSNLTLKLIEDYGTSNTTGPVHVPVGIDRWRQGDRDLHRDQRRAATPERSAGRLGTLAHHSLA